MLVLCLVHINQKKEKEAELTGLLKEKNPQADDEH